MVFFVKGRVVVAWEEQTIMDFFLFLQSIPFIIIVFIDGIFCNCRLSYLKVQNYDICLQTSHRHCFGWRLTNFYCMVRILSQDGLLWFGAAKSTVSV